MILHPPCPDLQVSSPSRLFFSPRRLLFPDPCHAYSCLISYFSTVVQSIALHSCFIHNQTFLFFSFSSSFFLLLSLSARSTSSSLFSISGRFQLSSPACQSVCDTRLIPPFVWHSKRTNNVASPRGPVEFLTTGWNLRRAISKPAPVFPPNTTRTRTPHREAQRGGNLADKRRFETALLSPLQFSDTRISALKLEGRSTAQELK